MPFEFKPTLDTLDGVPEQFQGLYVARQEGNGFEFHSDFKSHTHGLTSALDKERKIGKEAKTQLQAWLTLGEKPEDLHTKLTELTELVAKSGDSGKLLDKLKTDMEQGFSKKLSAKEQEVATMRGTVERYLVDNEATAAIAEAKGSVPLLLPHIKSQIRVAEENGHYVVRVVDKDGDPRGDGKGGFMTIKDLVLELRTSEIFGRAFDATGSTGGGKSPAGNGGKPVAGRQSREDMSSMDKIKAGLARK